MNQTSSNQQPAPNFSTLIMSLGSTAFLAMGLEPHPQTQKKEVDLEMARFNIDLLEVLQEKTKNNLLKEESDFLNFLLTDLRLKFVEASKQK